MPSSWSWMFPYTDDYRTSRYNITRKRTQHDGKVGHGLCGVLVNGKIHITFTCEGHQCLWCVIWKIMAAEASLLLLWPGKSGIVLCMRPANEKRRYNITSSLIGWAHAHNHILRNTSSTNEYIWTHLCFEFFKCVQITKYVALYYPNFETMMTNQYNTIRRHNDAKNLPSCHL